MAIRWSTQANLDLVRLHSFLDAVDPEAAADAVEFLLAGVRRLAAHPRVGPRARGFVGREVRRLVLGDHEVRYELTDTTIFILRLWHVREER